MLLAVAGVLLTGERATKMVPEAFPPPAVGIGQSLGQRRQQHAPLRWLFLLVDIEPPCDFSDGDGSVPDRRVPVPVDPPPWLGAAQCLIYQLNPSIYVTIHV